MQQTELKYKTEEFSKLLETIEVSDISEHIYCRNYLHHLIHFKRYYLAIYADLLQHALAKTTKSIAELSILDFGSGNGLLGMYVKYCGAKIVTLMDTDPLFIEASENLSRQLKIKIDAFYTGDENTLASIPLLDIIIGTDVIEHVYDIDVFFRNLKKINPQIISVFTTASNPENKKKLKKLMLLQIKDEQEGGVQSEGEAGHAPHIAFLQIRRNIIQNLQLNLSDNELDKLAVLTRGQNQTAIVKTIEAYMKSKVFPAPPSHPTNTCHPVTGSWTERILTISEYRNVYNKNGFYLDLYGGFYNQYRGGLKVLFAKLMNVIVRFTGIRFAPYIVLIGTPVKD